MFMGFSFYKIAVKFPFCLPVNVNGRTLERYENAIYINERQYHCDYF